MYACANLSFLFKEAGPIISRHKAAASKGFRFVENDFPTGTTPDELGQAVKESGVTQVLINCFHAVDVIKKINSPNIRLQLDLFHLQMICGNVSNNIKRLLPYTGHVQVAQSPDRYEPSFEGELNMKYVFSELQKAGYEGPVGCEYIPSKSTEESLFWIKDFGLKF
ncbi:putative hydroxypyruvate isomerase [Armadillidium nasatum]|uniref:Putative hydroxypyruvate isomerase n=1 Tax=Armadillidium nasatum TaxID=96803 RepID=A0A5N5TCW6_9CRUS|nr:putative hydroxypyruvate isomerase [Armadillidium nasatum]